MGARTPSREEKGAVGVVLDTSAVMRLLLDEPGADEVQSVLQGDQPVALPFVVLMELRYVLLRRLAPEQVERLIGILRATPATVVESSPAWGEAAARVKAAGGLSFADAWVAALALLRNATLLHSDPEFDGVAGLHGRSLVPRAAR